MIISKLLRSQPMAGGGLIQDPSVIPPPSYLGKSAAGIMINDNSAMSVVAFYACVQLITDSIAGLPRGVYRRPSDGSVRVKIEPTPKIAGSPFVGLTWREGIAQILVSLLTRGNSYIQIVQRDPDLLWPQKLYVHNPKDIRISVEKGEVVYKSAINGIAIDSDDIVHIRGMMLPGSVVGLAPVELAARSLGIGIAAEEYGARFFSQGSTVAGIIKGEDPLSEEEARALKQDFMSWHSGLGNAHLPLVLSGGMDYTELTLPPDQAQFLQTRSMATSDVARMFGVPPHMIGDTQKTTSWGKGIEDQEISFVTHTLMRWISRIEDAWQQKLLPRGNYLRFNLEGLLRTDTMTRYQSYTLARTGGWMNNNEIRAREDQPPIPGGDDYNAPMNAPTPAQLPGSPVPGSSADED